MIVRPRPSLAKLFFVMQGSIVPRIFPQILVIGMMSAGVVWAHDQWPGVLRNYSGAPFALVGIVLIFTEN